MTVVVRLFAGLRERAGWSRRELDVATVAEVWPALGLGDEPPGLLYAVNREYAEPGRELSDGDEVALIPPVSGGAFRVTEERLSLEAVVAEVADERAGGIATFSGTVRRQSRGSERGGRGGSSMSPPSPRSGRRSGSATSRRACSTR